MPQSLNTTNCANGSLLYILVGRVQLGRQMLTHISVLSSAITCDSCKFNYWKVIAKFHCEDDVRYQFLREHTVLPASVQCLKWHNLYNLKSDRSVWYCSYCQKFPNKVLSAHLCCPYGRH